MTQNIKEKEVQLTAASNGEAKTRKSPVYKITPEQFAAQAKVMDHKDLFSIRQIIFEELEERKNRAEKLVEELKGGKV